MTSHRLRRRDVMNSYLPSIDIISKATQTHNRDAQAFPLGQRLFQVSTAILLLNSPAALVIVR